MLSLKQLLLALAVAGNVFAQNDCQAPSNTIQNQGDAQALSGCQTVTGDIVIAGQTSGTIDLSGIQRINGSLICRDAAGLTGIASRDLTIIDKQFQLYGLTIMSSLDFPSLSRVGAINWTALPALQELSFRSQVKRAQNVYISNTELKSLDGINLEMVDRFDVNNNNYLTKIESQLGNISEALNIQANGKDLTVAFPNLEWANNMTFWNCSSVSLPSLAVVNQSMGFRGNFFETLSAPNLTRTDNRGDIVFTDNNQLTNISFPQLEAIGGTLSIANNTELKNLDGFQKLATVGGAIVISGGITNFTTPVLDDVRGAFNLQSTATFDCGPFKRAADRKVIKGTYKCSGAPGSTTSGSSASSTSSDSSSTNTNKPGAAGHLQVNVGSILGSVALAAGALYVAL
ncbi:MAG: hypothetical protein M1816_003333 [Peltula sp. TS41687]|nr:MAG: hypothetical protein M1816_003333 [Peltula sp. TS41687]